MKQLLVLSLYPLLMSCDRQRSQVQTAELTPPYTNEEITELYYKADTVINRHDSLFFVNTRRDTVVVETGIFTYLQHGYPLDTPYAPIALTRQAMAAEKTGDQAGAMRNYQAVVDYFRHQWLTRKNGFENGGFSDMNEMLANEVNVRLLASNAYEKLGELREALTVLTPSLANVEAEKSEIRRRYIELCIKQYGKAATRQELDDSGRTIHHAMDEDAPERDCWCVTIFGARMGIVGFSSKLLTPQEAQQPMWQQPYYALVK